MNKHKVSVNGIDMVYEECGESSGIAVILLHGFCGSSQYWHKVCPLLSKKYRIIMPQLRGHGGTSTPNGVYSMEAMADDIYKLMEQLEIDKVVMFGHSLGGYVTLAFADKYGDKLLGLGLIHSTALPDTEEVKDKRRQDIDDISDNGINHYVKKLIPKLFMDSKLGKMQGEVYDIITVGLEMTATGAIRTLEGMMQRPDRSHVLANATYPILLVAGAEDDIISPLDTFSITGEGITDSTFGYPHILENTFEGVAHMSLVEVPNQLSRVIANYLKILYEKMEKRAQ
ncbi:alpha/beta fold hydrolase [Paenibacillus endoradicis]|uniref:alpha/beta fold hydrolase n=1 Tax=Paenibacillus endoradicis TaxID=2972487 RepID=UPI00215946E2|nr:alpha/beta hydrolase [Paenibacillus endoradicis]MCR8659686.1 alpha/beta hydrolase [Paenibacillus endoradicis]